METKLINIGNSRGVIIPKKIIDRFGSKAFKISAKEGSIILKPVASTDDPRAGWQEAFADSVEKRGHDDDLLEGMHNEFDEDGWTW